MPQTRWDRSPVKKTDFLQPADWQLKQFRYAKLLLYQLILSISIWSFKLNVCLSPFCLTKSMVFIPICRNVKWCKNNKNHWPEGCWCLRFTQGSMVCLEVTENYPHFWLVWTQTMAGCLFLDWIMFVSKSVCTDDLTWGNRLFSFYFEPGTIHIVWSCHQL